MEAPTQDPAPTQSPTQAESQSRADIYLSTALLTLVGVGALQILSTAVPAKGRVAFGVFWTPVMFVALAMVLARLTGVRSWATLFGKETRTITVLKYLALISGVGLLTQALDVWAVARMTPEVVRGHQLAIFRLPAPNVMLFRSFVGSPISEELLFRGWLLGWFNRQGLPPLKILGASLDQAVLLTSLSFAVVHLVSLGGIPWALRIGSILVIAYPLGLARQKCGGLLAPMIGHFLLNFIGGSFFKFR